MGEYVWVPNASQIESANVTRLMRSCGFTVDSSDLAATQACVRAFIRKTQRDVVWFWERALADMGLVWERPYDQVLDVSKGHAFADWFVGGRTNIVSNCVDRHEKSALSEQTALISEAEDGTAHRYTYSELAQRVGALAAQLGELGVGVGDRVACYMPMVGEVVIALLATQKIGAIFVPIFSGFAPPAVRERLEDTGVKVVFTADTAMRRGKPFALKAQLDAAVDGLECVTAVVVLKRGIDGTTCPMQDGRDHVLREALRSGETAPDTVAMPAMGPALMLFTSGTTGKPKATVHTHAGCLAQMGKELCYNFDLRQEDVFFWVSDIGWMMGAWEIIGCLMHGACLVVFEGAPNYPDDARLWQAVERHEVTVLGISPTTVRMLMRGGDDAVEAHPMPSLRMLGSTGEPWDPESYDWYFEKVGRKRCPVINISGGTDIVGCFLAPLPIIPIKRASLQSPGLGMDVDVFDEQGNSIVGEVGYLVCKQPAPSMTRGLWNNEAQYLATYWSTFPEIWNHGDWAMVDQEGDWFVFGRADDTMKIAGRRVGPGEIESALIGHDAVSEAAAVGVSDELKGTDVVCFVVLHPGVSESEALRKELSDAVVAALGKVDKPSAVRFVDDLPKNRSGKILRRLISKHYQGQGQAGDAAHAANPEALAAVSASR